MKSFYVVHEDGDYGSYRGEVVKLDDHEAAIAEKNARISELELADKIWNKSSLVQMVKQIETLESANVGLVEALNVEKSSASKIIVKRKNVVLSNQNEELISVVSFAFDQICNAIKLGDLNSARERLSEALAKFSKGEK